MRTTNMKNMIIGLATLALIACGGSQKKGMSKVAAGAEPPPKVKGEVKVDREVTKKARAEFQEAVAYFNEQEEKGWPPGACETAAAKFQDVAGSHDKMVEAYYNAGVSYQKCGKDKDAEEMYKRAIKINPAHAPSLANLGEIYYRGGNETVGKQYFDQAYNADKASPAANNNLAWILYQKLRKTDSKSGGWAAMEDEARKHLSRALAGDNDNVVAYTLMALVYLEGSEKNRSRLAVAELLLREGEKRKSNYAPLYNAWGLLHLRKGNVGEALTQFRKAVELNPSFVEARMNMGQIVLSFRKYEEAAQSFQQVLEAPKLRKEDKYNATIGLGVALRGMGQIEQAAAKYEEAMQLDSGRGDAYYNLGVLWKDFRTNAQEPAEIKTAYQKAKSYFQQFLSKSGGGEKARDAKDNIEDCDKAIAALDEAIRIMREAEQQANQPQGGSN